MSIKYAFLGLIAEGPSHGYAIRAAFDERLGDFWELNYGQVYQVLAALEQEGLITGREEQVGKRPTRRVFAISPKGSDALRRWLAQPLSTSKPFRDDFYVRLILLQKEDRVALRDLVNARVDACERRLADLLDQRRPPDPATDGEKRWLFTEAAILHAEADLKAAELCRSTLARDTTTQPEVGERARRARVRR